VNHSDGQGTGIPLWWVVGCVLVVGWAWPGCPVPPNWEPPPDGWGEDDDDATGDDDDTDEDGLNLLSSEVENGGTLPDDLTCEGAGVSPALEWTDVPEGTGSFAVVVMNQDTGEGHWALVDIPADLRELAGAVSPDGDLPDGSYEIINDFYEEGYTAPCDDAAKGYLFGIYAVQPETLGLDPWTDYTEATALAWNNALDVGWFVAHVP